MKHIDARIYSGKTNFEWKDLKLNHKGLLPVIVQDFVDNSVLLYTHMNEDAWNKTLSTGLFTYFSDIHNRSIEKGKKYGNYQYVRELFLNGEKDALLVKVYSVAPICGDGKKSCFFNDIEEI